MKKPIASSILWWGATVNPKDVAKLEDLVASLRDLAAVAEGRMREAKRAEEKLRKTMHQHERVFEERVAALRSGANDLVEGNLRETLRMAAELATAEPIGPARVVAQRIVGHWGTWERSKTANALGEWISSLRGIADFGRVQVAEALNPALIQAALEQAVLKRLSEGLDEVQRMADELRISPEPSPKPKLIVSAKQPGRRSYPKRVISPSK